MAVWIQAVAVSDCLCVITPDGISSSKPESSKMQPGTPEKQKRSLKTRIFCVIVWWTEGGSNSRPPHCERGALPAELSAHELRIIPFVKQGFKISLPKAPPHKSALTLPRPRHCPPQTVCHSSPLEA